MAFVPTATQTHQPCTIARYVILKITTMEELKKKIESIGGTDTDTFLTQRVNEMYTKVVAEFDKRLKEYVRSNLSDIGYDFASEEAFIEFVKARVQRISHINWPRHYYELRLDDGTLIGSYSDNIDVTLDGVKCTVTIGMTTGDERSRAGSQ